jgi:hypothetical protein
MNRLQTPRTLMPRLGVILVGLTFVFSTAGAFGQQTGGNVPDQAGTAQAGQGSSASQPQESKRIFWIVPNYRTAPFPDHYQPLSAKEKFKIASQDSLDRGTVVLAALFGGEAQLTNSNRAFGQGITGYAQYFGASYGDFVIGNFMTEAIYPTILHQDPRYFRRGMGSGWSRLFYAVGQIFWTHKDSGGMQFNFSEVLGNATAAAISTAYYRDNRDASDAASKLGIQLGVDAASNVLKEFWPDLHRKFSRKKREPSSN